MIYYIQRIVGVQKQIYTTRDTLTLQEMDMHVNIGTPQDTQMKTKIIVELLQVIQIMLEVHGVINLVIQIAGTGVTCRYVEVSKSIPIHTYRSDVNQM
jgi:hypothetical protein